MKNYEQMTDHEINVEVATLLGESPWVTSCINFGGNSSSVAVGFGSCMRNVDYCNNPSDAWEIILENKISIENNSVAEEWISRTCQTSITNMFFICHMDKNPLRAAMIVFLKMKEQEEN